MAPPGLTAVVLATFVSFGCGALYFAPSVFGARWREAARRSVAGPVGSGSGTPRVGRVVACSLAFCSLQSVATALLLGLGSEWGFWSTVGLGVAIGLGLVAPSIGLIAQATGQGWQQFLIEVGYHTARSTSCALTLFWVAS